MFGIRLVGGGWLLLCCVVFLFLFSFVFVCVVHPWFVLLLFAVVRVVRVVVVFRVDGVVVVRYRGVGVRVVGCCIGVVVVVDVGVGVDVVVVIVVVRVLCVVRVLSLFFSSLFATPVVRVLLCTNGRSNNLQCGSTHSRIELK